MPSPPVWGVVRALIVTDDGTLLAGVGGIGIVYASGVYRSSDDGETWDPVGNDPGPVHGFADFGGSLFAASGNDVYRFDGTSQWVKTLESASVFRFATTDTDLYALGDSLYRTEDGLAWKGDALPANGARDIVVNSAGHRIVSSTHGIFISKAGGSAWTLVGEAATHLAITPDDHVVAGGRHSIRRSVEPVVLSSEHRGQFEIALQPPYPNPSSGSTRISFRLDEPSHVRLDVYDLLGRLIDVLLDGMMPAGSHEAGWEAAGVPSGTYLVRIQLGDAQMSRPLVLVR